MKQIIPKIVGCVRLLALATIMFCYLPSKSALGLTAIITKQNDFTTDMHPSGKSVAVPDPVAQKIEKLVDEAFSRWTKFYDKEYTFSRSYFFGPIFEIAVPNNFKLYVFRRTEVFQSGRYVFILFDSKANKCTQTPPWIYEKWMEGNDWGGRLQTPLISFKDIDGDGQEEIVVQERVHNGTMYNAVVYRYYYISSDLSLRQILAVETRLLDLYTEDQGGIINRSTQIINKGQIRLDSVLSVKHEDRDLGYVILSSPKPGEPFTVIERKVIVPRYARMLITASGVDETKFLLEGYRVYY